MAELGTPEPIQPDLFDGGAERPTDSARTRRLTATIDRIQARFGVDALRQGMSIDQRESPDD